MRKFIVFCAVAFLFLSFGNIVCAQKLDFRTSGFIDMVSLLGMNTPYAYDPFAPPFYGTPPQYNPQAPNFGQALDHQNSSMQTRLRLKFDAVMGKELSGTVYFEADSGFWGDAGDGRNNIGRWSADRAGLEIKNVYIDFAVPVVPVPTTVRMGLQTLAVRPHMVALSDGMGITAGIKVDPVTIQPLWFKALENRDYASDDVDIYGLNVFAKIKKLTVGGYGLYYNENTYPLPSAVTSTVNFNSDMWWLGAYTDGRLGPVDTNFDFVVDTGKVTDQRDIAVRQDVKYRGWATRLKVDYPWEKFNFGVIGMYASGSDQKKTSNTGLPGTITPYGTATTKVGGYTVPNSSEEFAFGDSMIISGSPVWNGNVGYNVLNYTQMHRGAIGGTWVTKLYGSYKATPWYKVTLAGIYIGDTTKNGNTIGNAITSGGPPRDDKTIGWEFDFINEINIYKNLKYDIGFGYLFAGKALDYFDTRKGVNISGNNPWVLITKLTYTF